MLPTDASGELVGVRDVVAQTEQVLDNIAAVLDHVGAGFEDVVKVVVYLTDAGDRPAVNTVRTRRFGAARPTSTLVQVAALAHPDALVEIDSLALLPGSRT